MAQRHITFFSEGIHFRLTDENRTRTWILAVLGKAGKSAGEINYIFCDDEYMLKINQEYLGHDTYTDIITFDMREEEEENISADIFVSVDRVKENAISLGEEIEKEMHRVIIHGVLHLIGFGDKTEKDRIKMRQKEDECLKEMMDNKI